MRLLDEQFTATSNTAATTEHPHGRWDMVELLGNWWRPNIAPQMVKKHLLHSDFYIMYTVSLPSGSYKPPQGTLGNLFGSSEGKTGLCHPQAIQTTGCTSMRAVPVGGSIS